MQRLSENRKLHFQNGVPGSAVGRGTELQDGRSLVRFPMGSLKYFIDLILPATPWTWDLLSL